MANNGESIVIARDKAVFWMDGQGRWRNRHGLFGHKGIIRHFNRSIAHDAGGFFVSQERDGMLEKVYFRCRETAIFAVDVLLSPCCTLCLNTGQRIDLLAHKLFICGDHLFQQENDYPVKFTDRAMMQLSPRLSTRNGELWIDITGSALKLPRRADLPTFS